MLENKTKLGKEPAFGYPAHTDIDDKPGYGRSSNTHSERSGMSKRLYIATNLTAARISSGKEINDIEATVRMHYEIADELLKQE